MQPNLFLNPDVGEFSHIPTLPIDLFHLLGLHLISIDNDHRTLQSQPNGLDLEGDLLYFRGTDEEAQRDSRRDYGIVAGVHLDQRKVPRSGRGAEPLLLLGGARTWHTYVDPGENVWGIDPGSK